MTLGNEIREGFAIDLEREMARKIIRATEKWRKGGKIKTAQERWLFYTFPYLLFLFAPTSL